MRQSNVRARMAEGATRLLATNGMEGTSFADVLALTDSPRGSVYHHFPGGKTELVRAALDIASERAQAAMETTRGQPAIDVVRAFLDLWRQLLDRTNLKAGCAVMAVTVSAGDSELLERAGTVFREWTEHLASLLDDGGIEPTAAHSLATLVIAATEGAVALSRAQRDSRPLDLVVEELLRLAAAQTNGPALTTRGDRTPAPMQERQRRARPQKSPGENSR